MKQNLKNYLFILFTLLIFTVFSALILTLLNSKKIISYKTSLIIVNSLSYLTLAILSFILGCKSKKHGLVHGLFFSLIVIALTLIMGNKINEIVTIIKVITKSLIIIFFTILGVNKNAS